MRNVLGYPMPQDADLPDRLETSACTWNAVVEAVYAEIERSLRDAGDVISRLMQPVRHRPKLAANRLRENAPGAAEDACGQLSSIQEILGDYQIEAEALRAQALRALDSAQRLANSLKPFRNCLAGAPAAPAGGETAALRAENARLRSELEQVRTKTAAQPPVAAPSQRERELEAAVESSRMALEECRRELAHLRAAPALPVHVQEELATLRVEVATLRETNERLRRPVPGTSVERFEVIASQAFDTEGQRKMLGQILVDAGIIKEEHLEIALYEQQSSWRRHLGAILVDLGFATEENIAHALAAQLALPFVDLRKEQMSENALALVGRNLAIHHTCFPLRLSKEGLRLAIANPLDLVALDDLRLAAGCAILPVVATAGQIKQAIRENYLV